MLRCKSIKLNILLKMILGEICEDFTDEELDEVILEVRFHHK